MSGRAGATEGPRAGGRRAGRDALLAALFLLPSLAVFASFFFWPLYRLVHLSLHQQNRFGTAERFVGTDLYANPRVQEEFFEGLRISGTFVLFTVPAGLLLGVLLAVAAHRHLRGIKIFQGIFSSTVASSVAVTSVVFFNLINPQVGYFGDVAAVSLSDPDTALRGVALSSIWQNLGLTFIIVLAGLQSLPEEVMEAATLDGFGPLRRFTRVTLPLLSPTLLFLAVVLVVFGMQAYAQVDILTAGGPAGATETLVFKIFNNQQPLAQGRGAVLSIGLFVMTLVVSLVQFMLLERRVYYEGNRA